MILTWLLVALVAFTLVVTYLFWVRPVLKQNPSFKDYYAQEESVWAALCLKFGGLKQKLTTAFVMSAGFVVSVYDFVAPLFAQSGVDVSTLTSKVPPQAWPIIGMALVALIQYFRNLADKNTDKMLERHGIDPDAKGGS